MSEARRLSFLDALRGLAAFAVVIQHSLEQTIAGFTQWATHNFNLGTFGVVSFFIVSGFVIPYSLERSNDARKFWVSRFFRLFPAYWTSLALVLILFFLGWLPLPGDQAQHIVKFALANMTMFQEAFKVPHAIPVYWTLSLEMAFYILISILFLLKLNKRTLALAWLGLTVVFVGCMTAYFVLHRSLPAGRLGLLATCFVGTAFFRVYKGDLKPAQLGWLLIGTAALLLPGMYIRFELLPKPPTPGSQEDFSFQAVALSWIAAYAFFGLFFWLRDKAFPNVLRYLGAISYSLYLFHPLVLDLLPRTLAKPLWFSLAVVGSIGIAALSYHFIELPSIELGRKVADKLKARPAIERSEPTTG